MLKENVAEALNAQMHREMYSSYLYLSMSAYFESVNLRGFATWMQVQAREELDHAIRFYRYIVERGGRVTLKAIDAPQAEWNAPLDAFEAAYGHEQKVTAWINELMDLSMAEKDYATAGFLQWFVKEQVEEEANASEIVFKMKFTVAEKGLGLLFRLDHELGKRVYHPPAE